MLAQATVTVISMGPVTGTGISVTVNDGGVTLAPEEPQRRLDLRVTADAVVAAIRSPSGPCEMTAARFKRESTNSPMSRERAHPRATGLDVESVTAPLPPANVVPLLQTLHQGRR